MKKVLILLSMLMVFGTAGVAYSIPYTAFYDAGHRYMNGTPWNPDTVSWVFDIRDDGFAPDIQDVTSASITLNFSDDNGRWDLWEVASLNIGTNHFLWEVNTGDVAFTLSSIVSLSETGRVAASLSSVFGDFYFNSATLTAEGTSAPVPEPASILLFGAGLAGLAAATRRRLRLHIK